MAVLISGLVTAVKGFPRLAAAIQRSTSQTRAMPVRLST
jgi:hypothetical protein